ncbi:unnamed protein product [Gordionus sp. m RMFG-2023]
MSFTGKPFFHLEQTNTQIHFETNNTLKYWGTAKSIDASIRKFTVESNREVVIDVCHNTIIPFRSGSIPCNIYNCCGINAPTCPSTDNKTFPGCCCGKIRRRY